MLDFLTLKLPLERLDLEAVRRYLATQPVISKYTPATGEIEWTIPAWESIRSDTHQVTLKLGAVHLVMMGSPARSMGLGHNVFGSDDVEECARAHIAVARKVLPFALPEDLKLYSVSRVDVTYNFVMGGAREVQQCLDVLEQVKVGRYRAYRDPRDPRGTVYFAFHSRMREGKAYHKGRHVRMKRAKLFPTLTDEQVELADRLLRLELMLGSQWWFKSEKDWWKFTAEDWRGLHEEYFRGVIGAGIEVMEMDGLYENLMRVAKTEGQGLAAYRTWGLIKTIGVYKTEAKMSARTWRLHRKLLFQAGLSGADLVVSNVVPFRPRMLLLGEPVTSWEQLRRAV